MPSPQWHGLASRLVAVALVATARPALAGITAQAVPVKYNLTVRPGTPVARDVTIRNLGDGPVVVRVRLSDWTIDERGRMEFVPAGSTRASLAGLVTFEPGQFSLQAGESGVIHVVMRLPELSEPATRWGILLSEVRPARWPDASFGPRAIAELGTTLYLSRLEAASTRAELAGMRVESDGDSALSLAVTVRNPGERHLYSTGAVSLRDSTGATVATGELGTGVVLPGTWRMFTWTCPLQHAAGRYTVTATLDTGEPELIVGETEVRWPPVVVAPLPFASRR